MSAEIAMQTRCVHCLSEQYAMAVLPVSLGEAGCAWCGEKSTPMTEAQWREALALARRRRERESGQ